jgi:protein-disulfide isomerase
MDYQTPHSFVTLPGAIIVAGALIAIAVIWVNKPASTPSVTKNEPAITEINMRPVTSSDHILGNPNASIKIVEYSDSSCPACKMFNPVMEQIMNTYGPSGNVAWVYRYFPIDKPGSRPDGDILHVNAGHEAQALECAASLGGNDKFWAFEKRLYEITPSVTSETPNGLDQKQLPEIAKFAGIDAVAFNDCLSSGRFKDKVEADYTDGIKAGLVGTPYSIIITPSGSKIPLNGAQSYTILKSAIDTLLAGGK